MANEQLNKKRCRNQDDELKRRAIWSSTLHTDIMLVVLDKLLEPIDHARFARVCKEWYSLTKQYSRTRQPWLTRRPPMLYVPAAPRARLYSISETRIYDNVKLPVLDKMNKVYCGHGWVGEVTEDYDAKTDIYCVSITLVNHFGKSRETIRLPSLMTKRTTQHCLACFLSADPILDRDNYVVTANHRRITMCLFKSGQECWEELSCLNFSPLRCMTYYQGRAYGINTYAISETPDTGKFVSYDVNSFEVKEYIVPKPQSKGLVGATYIVKPTKGDLLFVNKIVEFEFNKGHERRWSTRSFEVYKLVVEELGGSVAKLVEMNNIGDEALFVGDHQSFSCSASNYPGCQPNCIYYTRGDYAFDSYEVGIFNLENGSIKKLSQRELEKLESPAVWITPSFAFD